MVYSVQQWALDQKLGTVAIFLISKYEDISDFFSKVEPDFLIIHRCFSYMCNVYSP